jgi:hypothetical protein
MDRIIKPIPENISIYARIELDSLLNDRRAGRNGLVFGQVKTICNQYGIQYKQLDNCVEFFAPKDRLQIFVEKLHFSLTRYSESPF